MKFNPESQPTQKGFAEVKNFRELFTVLNSDKNRNSDYRNAYEEAAHTARGLVETKTKAKWNPDEFARSLKDTYPKISNDFIEALQRCIGNYNPIVNIPDKSLWDND